ncbi:AraC family transcriptional regulator ligand-binding domain-containing protein [Bradyrhizobium sp.]|uniref:AraC family transcriptional regulator ligand-binding domain-containing protein n=1 Tax=Bradyrhizobium sp. TaxID=376 RepID=UPI0040376BCF
MMRHTVTVRFAQALLEAALQLGVEVPAEMRQALTSGPRVPMAEQDAFWSLFCAARPEPLAGLRLGLSLQAGHLDIVGLLLLSCETLGDALEVLAEYAPIVGDQARFEVVRAANEVTLRYWPEFQACRNERVEATLGCVVNLARWMTSRGFQPRELLFAHHPSAEAEAYAALLCCPVRFGADVNGVVMDASELARPLIHAGGDVHAHLRALADDMLASLRQGSLSAKVEQVIRAHPRWGKERIAETLGISGRHLNRKLGAESVSFKALRETVLFGMAREALHGRQPTSAISAQLGFSDENAFSRAFSRWSGQTPAQYARGVSL